MVLRDFKNFLYYLIIDKSDVPVNVFRHELDMAYSDPNACKIHGYKLEWRTCLECDIIKLEAQHSLAGWVDPDPYYETRQRENQRRLSPRVTSTRDFSANNSYDSGASDDRDDYPERIALTSRNDRFSDEETTEEPHRRRSHLQKKSRSEPRSEPRTDAGDNWEDDMERLPLSNGFPQMYPHETPRRHGGRKRRGAMGRHVSFAE